MSADLIDALRELEREKGISVETILHGLEEALGSAFKTMIRHEMEDEDEDLYDVRFTIDPESGETGGVGLDMHAFLRRYDVEGNLLSEEERPVPDEFKGRIMAQTAKQVILQKIRDAEREMTYEEFAGREGDVVTGIVQQDSHRYTLLDLGKVEALLPVQEQVPSEPYRHGERLKAYIVEVRKTTKGPQIIVSRTHPNLLRALFELEVPEIAEGIVEIKAVAREPGHRSKIAVASNEPGVDPVGACVGAKGSRVRMVVNELKGEKIDVVEWSEERARFVEKALSPAKVHQVRIDDDTQTALVVVPDYQLSLAIGKEGQNARLAARLTGLRIDISSETQASAAAAAPKDEEVAPPRTETEGVAGPTVVATDEASEQTPGPEEIGVPPAEARCEAVLGNGERCANPARPGSPYCGIPAHQKQAAEA